MKRTQKQTLGVFLGFFNSNICTTSKRKKITLKRKKSPGSPN